MIDRALSSGIARPRIETAEESFVRVSNISGRAREQEMSVTRVTEISAGSPQSFADAINALLNRADALHPDIERAWVQDMRVVIKGGRVEEYRVSMKLTFVT